MGGSGNIPQATPKTSFKTDSPRKHQSHVQIEMDTSKCITDDIHNIVYFDGDGELRIGADDIPFNVHLLRIRVITFFVVDWRDYSDFEVFKDILTNIMETDTRDMNKWEDQLVMFPSLFGILVTNKHNWILKNLCIPIMKDVNKYQVCKLSEKIINELLTPPSLMKAMFKFDRTISGDKYIIYAQYKNSNNSIPIKRLNCKAYAELYYKFLGKHKPDDYTLTLFDTEAGEVIHGFIKNRKYDLEVLDKDLDLEKYIEELGKTNDELYKNDRILKFIRSLC